MPRSRGPARRGAEAERQQDGRRSPSLDLQPRPGRIPFWRQSPGSWAQGWLPWKTRGQPLGWGGRRRTRTPAGPAAASLRAHQPLRFPVT